MLLSRVNSTLPRPCSLACGALDRGQVPAVGLALEGVDHRLHGRAQADALVALHEGQHLLLGLAEGGRVVAQETGAGLQADGNVAGGVGDAAQHAQVRVGARQQLVKAQRDPRPGIAGAGFHVLAVDHQLRLLQQVFHQRGQPAQALLVAEGLVVENALDALLLHNGAVLAHVLVGALDHQQVAHQPVVGRQDDQQVVAAQGLGAQQRLVAGVLVEGADHVDAQFIVAAQQAFVQPPGKWIVLAVFVANLAILEYRVEDELAQFFGHGVAVDLGVLDLLLDVLLFVGQVLVFIAVALDVGLLLQQIQRRLDLPAQRRQVGIEASSISTVMLRRVALNSLTYFTRKSALSRLHSQADRPDVCSAVSTERWICDLSVVRMPSNIRSKVASWPTSWPAMLHRDVLKDLQHRALAHRAMFALEGVVLRQVLDRGLEE
jgi:hypothetical protein